MARKRREVSAKLARLKEHVARWREERGGRGGRIPGELWREAVSVARSDGVFATAQGIGFNRGRLADRVASTATGGDTDEGADRKEGERGHGARCVSVEVARPSGATVIDVVGRHGERMRVEGMSGAEVCALIDRLWKLA